MSYWSCEYASFTAYGVWSLPVTSHSTVICTGFVVIQGRKRIPRIRTYKQFDLVDKSVFVAL
eukprot:3507965-Rhodomonas_salina.3